MNGRGMVTLIFAAIVRVALIFKPAIGDQTDCAIDIADILIDKVQRKHGKIDFNG